MYCLFYYYYYYFFIIDFFFYLFPSQTRNIFKKTVLKILNKVVMIVNKNQ